VIRLDDDTVDKIVIIALKSDYKIINKGIRNIKSQLEKGKADSHAYNDLKQERKLLKSIKRTLRYKMPIYEYENFIKENR
jgi:hypothetical protein